MTPEKQRIAIAEAVMNKALHHCPTAGSLCLVDEEGKHYNDERGNLPNYLSDLNAMHEAEKVLNEKQQVWYLQKLTQVRFKAGVAGMIACMNDKTTFATAPQRAEAFLRTIGKWEE